MRNMSVAGDVVSLRQLITPESDITPVIEETEITKFIFSQVARGTMVFEPEVIDNVPHATGHGLKDLVRAHKGTCKLEETRTSSMRHSSTVFMQLGGVSIAYNYDVGFCSKKLDFVPSLGTLSISHLNLSED